MIDISTDKQADTTNIRESWTVVCLMFVVSMVPALVHPETVLHAQTIYAIEANPSLAAWSEVNAVEIGDNDYVWMASDAALLCFVNCGYTEYTRADIRLPGARLNDLAIDGDLLWVAGEDGLMRYDSTRRLNKSSVKHFLPGREVKALSRAVRGGVYAVTANELLSVSADSVKVLFELKSPAENDMLLTVELAPDGSLWCGTAFSGIVRLFAGKIKMFHSANSAIASNHVPVILPLAFDDVFISDWGHGLKRYARSEWKSIAVRLPEGAQESAQEGAQESVQESAQGSTQKSTQKSAQGLDQSLVQRVALRSALKKITALIQHSDGRLLLGLNNGQVLRQLNVNDFDFACEPTDKLSGAITGFGYWSSGALWLVYKGGFAYEQ